MQAANEEAGFGVRYTHDSRLDKLVLPSHHRIVVKFPFGLTRACFRDAGDSLFKLVPGAVGDSFTLVSFFLMRTGKVTIEGFGIPFANKLDPQLERLVNGDQPITEDITVADILRQRQFHFLVRSPSCVLDKLLNGSDGSSYRCPYYGTEHHFDVARYKDDWGFMASPSSFPRIYGFEHTNEHLCAVSQSVVQDVFWLEMAADRIAEIRQPAYFVPASGQVGSSQTRYLIVLHEDIVKEFEAAWCRLTKKAKFIVQIYDCYKDKIPTAKWKCDIVDKPESIAELHGHVTDTQQELVLAVRVSSLEADINDGYGIKTFQSRSVAQEALKEEKDNWNWASIQFGSLLVDAKHRVEATCLFEKRAAPSNPRVHSSVKTKDRMKLHRALVEGMGFWDWMSQPGPLSATHLGASLEDSTPQGKPKLRPLLTVNFLEPGDIGLIGEVIKELLPADRNRFCNYLSCRPLGLGLITAAPGFSKTTELVVAAIVMLARLGNILCSAPSGLAVSSFARRIDGMIKSVCARCNRGKAMSDPTRRRHNFVVRGYKDSDEVNAVIHLLEHPEHGDLSNENNRPLNLSSKWRLDMSFAFWTLAVLRARGAIQLHPDDCRGLHDLRQKIDQSRGMQNIRAVATGQISWQEYVNSGDDTEAKVQAIISEMLKFVDILCTTPTMTEECKPYSIWKANKAQGIAVDEAGAMHRADLYMVWGNCLLPCFLGGDPNRLSPAVLTEQERDAKGNVLNRFASMSKISALEFFQATGFPIFRTRSQLPSDHGLFDTVSKAINDSIAKYREALAPIDNEKLEAGQVLEEYIAKKYPSIIPSASDKPCPLFIHCESKQISVNPSTHIKMSLDQVTIALDFLSDLVKTTTVKASQIVILAPDSVNVGLIQKLVTHQQYAKTLKDIGDPSTIEEYQSQEHDIVVIVMGTRARSLGAGLTSDRQRLGILLKRQTVLVGDINVTGPLDYGSEYVEQQNTEFNRDEALLRKVYMAVWEGGRVATVKVDG
ncbi:P-loop containing nucleoside triphosphate hydrolase protein [Annulohypoxylon moriforme]|nr:P-loop containing nucleoside triphosphate hydrolase protein [Annulohypoxylon moriforme]